MNIKAVSNHNTASLLLQATVAHKDLFIKLIEAFPYPVEIFAPDGAIIMANQAFFKEFRISEPAKLIGKYNILRDPIVRKYRLMENIKKAFAGTPTFVSNAAVPVHLIKKYYNIPVDEVELFYQEISNIPLLDENKKIICVVSILITQRKLLERAEIAEAKAYIQSHWLGKFHVEDVAGTVSLSGSHLSRLFKIHTGMTLHDYYIKVKIDKIKERLLDVNLSIEEAFTACGVHYHSYYARLFKHKTGLTPMKYRKLAQINFD